MKKNVPLKLALIEEGELVENLDAELADVVRRLLAHVKKHEDGKAKAELTLKLKIGVENLTDGAYSIRSEISTKAPGRPARATLAIHEIDLGQPTLFVRASGSDEDSPRQQKLATRDGRAIDQDSGEARPHDAPKKEKS